MPIKGAITTVVYIARIAVALILLAPPLALGQGVGTFGTSVLIPEPKPVPYGSIPRGSVEFIRMGVRGAGCAPFASVAIEIDPPTGPNGIQAVGWLQTDATGQGTGAIVTCPGAGYLTTPNVRVVCLYGSPTFAVRMGNGVPIAKPAGQ